MEKLGKNHYFGVENLYSFKIYVILFKVNDIGNIHILKLKLENLKEDLKNVGTNLTGMNKKFQLNSAYFFCFCFI